MAKSVRRSDVSVEYVWPGRRTLTFGWQQGEIIKHQPISKVNRIVSYILPGLALDGVEVKLEGFDRYSNQFTEMAWGARQISVQVMRLYLQSWIITFISANHLYRLVVTTLIWSSPTLRSTKIDFLSVCC